VLKNLSFPGEISFVSCLVPVFRLNVASPLPQKLDRISMKK